jgi:hemolysin activation/secretion protein
MTMSRMAGLLPVVFACQAALAQSPAFDIASFSIEGATLVDAARLQAVAAPFAGAGKGMDGVNAATAAIREAYAQAGYPIVQVYAPAQQLQGGAVVLRVVEGKLARVAVAGQRAYTEQNVRASLPPLREGEKPNTNAVAAAVLLANDNPARQVSVNFSPGTAPGDVDARIDVAEDKVSKTSVTLDNAGSRTTGRARIALGYQHANLFDRDHVLNLQAMTGLEHPSKSASLTAAYRVPFYQQRLSLDVIAAYSDSKSDTTSIAGPLFFSGKGVYAGLRLNQALPSRGDYRQKLVYGIDYKDFNNSCSIGAIALDRCGTVTSVPVSLTYLGQAVGARFQAGASLGYYRNIPGGSHGGQTEYGTHPRNWQALRGSAFVGVATGDWQWRATVNGQASSDALIPSEQFGIGGAASVRGYDERTSAADKGVTGSLELYTPELAGGQAGRHTLRLLAFYDAGYVHNSDATPPAAKRLSSVGTGLRYGFGKEVALRCDVGFAETAVGAGSPSARDRHDAFAHVNFVYSF